MEKVKPPLIRMFPDISISEENLKLEQLINEIETEDSKVLSEIIKLEKEIKSKREAL